MLGRLVSIPRVREFALRRLAGVPTKAAARPRPFSYGHAVVRWGDGREREGWLRVGDARDFTAEVLTEVAVRLRDGEGKPGAYTPEAAFGPEIAIAAGGVWV